jgi:hypothetical protein
MPKTICTTNHSLELSAVVVVVALGHGVNFFLKISLMTITQHANINNFQTLIFCLKKYFFLNFINANPKLYTYSR